MSPNQLREEPTIFLQSLKTREKGRGLRVRTVATAEGAQIGVVYSKVVGAV